MVSPQGPDDRKSQRTSIDIHYVCCNTSSKSTLQGTMSGIAPEIITE